MHAVQGHFARIQGARAHTSSLGNNVARSRLIRELRRRHVFRVAIAYAVVGWALIEVGSTIIPALHLSDSLTTAIVVLVLLGFPVAVVLAWAFEMTPEGVRLTEPETSAEARAPEQHRHVGRKLDFVIIAVLAVAVAALLWRQFVMQPDVVKPDAATIAAAAASAEKSIAVLPFENLSADKDNAYFADGIQDEILTGLAKIGQLKVISRTSTKSYGSRPDNIPQIAKELGVANILEGSVQKVGDRVRINVQLISADTDSHLWAETYDRTLEDVFAVQSEVAQKIASSLRATLTQDERATLTRKPTDNPAAYDAYLRGLALDAQGFELSIARKATLAYAEAVRLDPDFALAWSQVAISASYLYFNGVDPDTYTADYIKRAADIAFRLQPGLAEAQLAQGYYRYRVLRDFPGAAKAFEVVLKQAPNNPLALVSIGVAERRAGKWDEALQHLEKSAERDPRNPGLMVVIGGETMNNMRLWKEGSVWLDRALALSPGSAYALSYKIAAYQLQGRLQDAARLLKQMPQAGEDPQIAWFRSNQHFLERRFDLVVAELKPLLAQSDAALNGWGPQLSINLGYAQHFAGDDVQARITFQRLIDRLGPNAASQVDDSFLPAMLALANAGLGNDQLALQQARHAVALYRSDALFGPQAEAVLAQIQAKTGDHQAAIASLAKLLEVPSGITVAQLRLDPAWDPLRKEPAFQALLKQPDAPQ